MLSMLAVNATEVRKNWSSCLDEVRKKPIFIKRTHDFSALMDVECVNLLLGDVKLEYSKITEEDGSVVISGENIDIVSSGATEQEAVDAFVNDIIEYAQEFYEEFDFWSSAKNRKAHIPIVLKVLISNNKKEVEEMLECQNGRS